MSLVYLETFYEVARLQSFSAAADALDVSKGLVSRHVRQLEKDMNAQLFHRTTRVVTLTEAGSRLFTKAEQIFLLAREAAREVRDITEEASGVLRFTAPLSLGERLMGDLLPEYRSLCPGVKVELDFSSASLSIEHGHQDIALRAADRMPDNVVARHIGRMRNILLASPEYLLQHGDIARPEDLNRHECLLSSHRAAWNEWKLTRGDEVVQVNAKGQLSSNQYTATRQLALAGQGVASLPVYLVEEDIEKGRLKHVLPEYILPLHDLSVVVARHRMLPRKIITFRELIERWFRDHPFYLV
ncbi:hypothetical protein BTA51_14985 [Hahella sp. CCB-MM4]|uniref:LysR family transcriptional regulator n=1 Tax=Hahella sp. (strain CCB-MM4) TaxID=1926491 RepID=UPI000B9C5569|nr:LysR family transcriptional regulator [Hahella sp. CCB-MM4]OZG72432.1 hypothetical protein BTA51_14985 [Hahella sp. CCB-MM4]